MITSKEMNFHPPYPLILISSPRKRSKTFRNNILIFIPKVEHIAQQIDCRSLMLNAIQEAYKAAFMCATVLYSERTEVCIGKEIDILHVTG